MSALALTASDLVRALGDIAARPAVKAALREHADRVADTLGEAIPGARATVQDAAGGAMAVTVAAPNLFARTFGGVAGGADPAVTAAFDRIAGRAP